MGLVEKQIDSLKSTQFRQLVAQAISLGCKRVEFPSRGDTRLFSIGPSIAVISILLSYLVIPFGYHLVLADLSIGVFLWIAISSIAPVGLLMSGYGSNNKYSFLGGLRAAAQSISYEIPLTLCMIVTSALIIWEGLMCITGSESPVVVVLSGSMEPGFKRGDVLFLHMSKEPIRAGEIVVFNVKGRDIPIVHRVIKVHEHEDGEVDVLTKGDNNPEDDHRSGLYAQDQMWLQRKHIMGRAVGFLPYVGWVTIIMTEKPAIKYILICALGLLVITSKE